MNTGFLNAALLLAVIAGAAHAADESALQRCRAIESDSMRLACYDALPAPTPAAAPVAAPVAAEPAVSVATMATPAPSLSQSTPSSPATQAVQATPAAAPKQPPPTADRFGLEQVEEALQQAIVSRIPGQFQGWQAKSKITLENGQVWQIVDGTRGVYQLDNPAVTIERAMLGSFRMVIEGANRSPKVKRLK